MKYRCGELAARTAGEILFGEEFTSCKLEIKNLQRSTEIQKSLIMVNFGLNLAIALLHLFQNFNCRV